MAYGHQTVRTPGDIMQRMTKRCPKQHKDGGAIMRCHRLGLLAHIARQSLAQQVAGWLRARRYRVIHRQVRKVVSRTRRRHGSATQRAHQITHQQIKAPPITKRVMDHQLHDGALPLAVPGMHPPQRALSKANSRASTSPSSIRCPRILT